MISKDSPMFDKIKLINNIKVLAKRKDIQIGQLESQAGVSTGYLSRQASSASGMGIAVVAQMAQVLDVSLDDLVNVDLETTVSGTEAKVINFIKKVGKDSHDERLNWAFYDKVLLRQIDGKVDSPQAFGFNPFFLEDPLDDNYDSDVRFLYRHQLFVDEESKDFVSYYIEGPGYYVELNPECQLLISQVRYIPFNAALSDSDPDYTEGSETDQKMGVSNVELFLASYSGQVEALSNKRLASERLTHEIDELVREAKASTERVQLSGFTKGIIDSYMNPPVLGQSKTATPFGQGSNTFGATPSSSNDDDIPF